MNTPALVRAARGLAAPGDVVALVGRPRGVTHLYVGPLTPSGGFVPRDRRTACRAHTARLAVAATAAGTHRVCARCSACLLPRGGQAEQHPVTRDQHLTAYGALTISDLHLVLELATTVDETHRVGFLTSLLFGPPPVRRPADNPAGQALFDLAANTVARRRALVAAARTPEEIAAIARQREIEAHNEALTAKARREAVSVERALARRSNGQYLTPYERDLVSST